MSRASISLQARETTTRHAPDEMPTVALGIRRHSSWIASATSLTTATVACGGGVFLVNNLNASSWYKTAARIVTRTRKREHITPVLKELHWLPVTHKRYEGNISGSWILAGTPSARYSCTIPSLVISTMSTDSKCYWKTHQKEAWFQSFL